MKGEMGEGCEQGGDALERSYEGSHRGEGKKRKRKEKAGIFLNRGGEKKRPDSDSPLAYIHAGWNHQQEGQWERRFLGSIGEGKKKQGTEGNPVIRRNPEAK